MLLVAKKCHLATFVSRELSSLETRPVSSLHFPLDRRTILRKSKHYRVGPKPGCLEKRMIASAPLLARVSGLGNTVAQGIVAYRDQKGMFTSRAALREVPRLGDKTFEQAAGFLRVMNGENPLDASAVHPESYPVVKKILGELKKDIKEKEQDKST